MGRKRACAPENGPGEGWQADVAENRFQIGAFMISMPRFITIGYGDQSGYDRTAKAVRNAAHAADADRMRQGDVMGIAGKPVQVRNHDAAKTEVAQGPYLSADLPIAGFALIEAADLQAAIEIAAKSPCAVAHGVVEVWPLDPTPEA
jgi:hypothetical protein